MTIQPYNRAKLIFEIKYTPDFLKDWQRHNKSGRNNMAKAKEVMMLLAMADAPLPPQFKDHALARGMEKPS